jgi:rhamnogalacturonyl hydrolase YesR
MILSAMARGIRLGWLDQTYRPIVERAWQGLAAHVMADGSIVDVCTSTGAGPTRRYYLDRPAVTGADDRGGAMALLAAIEMYELRR